MNEALTIISVSVTMLSVVLLFLYVRKSEEYTQIKVKMDNMTKLGQHDQETQRARDDFLAMVVHEMRSPLVSIGGYVRIVKESVKGDAVNTRRLEKTEGSGLEKKRLILPRRSSCETVLRRLSSNSAK